MVRNAAKTSVALVLFAAGLLVSGPPTPVAASGAGEATTVRLDGMADRLAAGDAHTCAILDSGGVTCWGDGFNGRLGYGTGARIGDNETPAANPENGGIVPLPGGLTATAITAGTFHTCALLANGTVTCWGYGSDGALGYGNTNVIGDNLTPATNPINGGIVPLPGGQAATAITAGGYHTCALLADGTVTCWGFGGVGALGYGSGANVGDNETPATNPVNGGIVPLPGGQTATAITAGREHTCALLANGTLTCWGRGDAGRLGYGNTDSVGDDDGETPATNPVNGGIVPLPGGQTATAITAGGDHTCAILANGTATCWGLGTDGTLGYGNSNNIGDSPGSTPATNPANGGIIALPGGQTATAITAGDRHTCALLTNGALTCWGRSDDGRLGYANPNDIGDDETPATNPAPGGPVIALPSGNTAITVSAGGAHTCALLANGTLTCWGSGALGRLGFGNINSIGDNETPAANPTDGGVLRLPGTRTATAVATGNIHACALLANGTVTCWGEGDFGRLGYGNTDNIGDNETPAANPANGGVVALPGGQTATALAAGFFHTCALLANGSVTCWGLGANGQLGYGNTNSIGDNETPATNPINGGIVALPGGQTATAISAGDEHTCAVLASGAVTCWGLNYDGRLGYGNTNSIGNDETPAQNPVNGGIVALPGGQTATAITAAAFHTCAVLSSGGVTCWGEGTSGHLGYGNTNDIGDNETPAQNPVNAGIVPLPAGRPATAIAANGLDTCALLSNGTVTCWGYGKAMLGYGNTNHIGDNETPATNPVNGGIVALPGGQIAATITVGGNHACALLAAGAVTCWGEGDFGRLGYGNTNDIGDNETPAQNPVNGGIVQLPGGLSATAVSAGGSSTCALLAGASITCWGLAAVGQLGYGNTTWVGDDETPANNPTNGGIVSLPNHLSATDYRPLAPARLLDTRASGATVDDQFEGGGQRTAGSTLTLAVAGRGGIAADATSITLSIAAIAPAVSGYLTIWPCSAPQPNASSLNYAAGVNTANTVITGITGGVCVFTSQPTQLIADVVGFTPRSSSLTSLTPARYLDTRSGGSTFDDLFEAQGHRPGGSTLTLNIANRGNVPASTRTVILNVAAVTPAAGGFLTIWPCDQPQPNASNLNYTTGVNAANLVITRAAANGTVCVYTSQPTHLIADVVGFYRDNSAPGPSSMRTVNPGRLVDTRANGATTDNRYEKTGSLVANATNTYQITNRFPVANANVALLNITAVSPLAGGFITVWPCDQSKPNASSLNFVTGVNRAVQVLTKVSPSGTVCIASSQPIHLLVDATGTTM